MTRPQANRIPRSARPLASPAAPLLVLSLGAALAAGCGPDADCRPNEVRVGDRCAMACADDRGCPAAETCNLAVGACLPRASVDGGTSPNCDDPADPDQDGLKNCEERRYGTSPENPDTDGDGVSDGREVKALGFSPDVDNYRFNPRIADLPRLEIEIERVPEFVLDFERDRSSTGEVSVSRSMHTSEAFTKSRSTSESHGVEASVSVFASVTTGVSVEAGFPSSGATASVEATFGVEASTSLSVEHSIGYSTEQTRENSRAYEETVSRTRTQGETLKGGRMLTTVSIKNVGHQTFRIESLTLSAFNRERRSGRTRPIGNLSFDNAGAFSATSIGPGNSLSDLIFSKNDLVLEQMMSLLGDSSGVQLDVSQYELLDDDGTPLAFDLTAVGANTARIMVDYGPGALAPEDYRVSTTGDPATKRISLRAALEDVLRLPLEYDGGGMITGVRGKRLPPVNAIWLVVHATKVATTRQVRVYSGRDTDRPYSVDDVFLKAGDTVHLVYLEDADRDGLGARAEQLAGTSDSDPDSDDDGLTDGHEVAAGWSPLLADTDRDGHDDADEVYRSISTYRRAGFLVSTKGTLFSWGPGVMSLTGNDLNGDRPLVYGDGTNNPLGPQPWVFVGAFAGLACPGPLPARVLDRQGCRVYAWGRGDLHAGNAHGLGPDGPRSPHFVEVPPPAGTTWVDLATSRDERNAMSWKVGLTRDGELYGWGAPPLSSANASSYEAYFGPAATETPRRLGGGFARILDARYFVKDDGTLWGWGDRATLGLAGDGVEMSPVQVSPMTGWVKVSTSREGSAHQATIGLRSDGSVWAWGTGVAVAMGLTPSVPSEPDRVETRPMTRALEYVRGPDGQPRRWKSIGWNVAVAEDGTLWKFGYFLDSMDGSGLDGHQPRAVQLGADTDWIDADTNAYLLMVGLKANGRLYTGGRAGFSGLGTDARFPTLLDAR